MEILRMDYRFTAILIIMFICLTLFAKPAYPKNEYLNNGTNTCSTGSVEASIEKEDRNGRYNHYYDTNNYNNDDENYRSKHKTNFCRIYVADGRKFIQTISRSS